MYLFYAPKLGNNFYCFDENESKHIAKVLRLKEKELVYLTDGLGNLYEGILTQSDWKQCCVSYKKIQSEYGKRPYNLHVAIAPTKSIERFEWFLEKATEIGIDEITPLICSRSERKFVKKDRAERIIVSAMKQALKTYKPILNDITDFGSFVKKTKNINSRKLIAHCYDEKKERILNCCPAHQDVIILIGPEGDFSMDEIEIAGDNGFISITLGECRLRTETAGVVACSTLYMLNL